MGGNQSHDANSNQTSGARSSRHPPLFFSQVCGENVQLSHNGSVARRSNSFCKGIVFSDRAIRVNEKVCVKFVDVSTNWSGVLRFGFTNVDPATIRSNLPRYACPDLTSKQGYWAKAFNDIHVKKDSILYYYVNSSGEVYYGINGEENKAVFFSGVDTRKDLWALMDIYGNTIAIELVDPKAHLNNARRHSALPSTISQSMEELRLLSAPSISYTDLLRDLTCLYPENNIYKQEFHRVKGNNITLNGSRCLATKGGHGCNIVFTSRPIKLGELLLIKLEMVDGNANGPLLDFGLTSCSPGSIHPDQLPNNSDLLLDRLEYWVVHKNTISTANPGDSLAFTVSEAGEVVVAKDGGLGTVLMHVDTSIPLWAFFDLHSVKKISLPVDPNRPIPSSTSFNGNDQLDNFESLFPDTPPSLSAQIVLSNPPNNEIVANDWNNTTAATMSEDIPTSEADSVPVECLACCERPIDSVFYQCGHMCMCFQCALEYWRAKGKGHCPICRVLINDVIRTYKS